MKTPKHLLNERLHSRLAQIDIIAESIRNFLSIPTTCGVWPLIRAGRLILLTDDPMLGVQLRYKQRALQHHLNQTFDLTLIGVDIKLTSLPLARNEQNTGKNKISTQTADIMKSIASDIEDEGLRDVMCRLADSTSRDHDSTPY